MNIVEKAFALWELLVGKEEAGIFIYIYSRYIFTIYVYIYREKDLKATCVYFPQAHPGLTPAIRETMGAYSLDMDLDIGTEGLEATLLFDRAFPTIMFILTKRAGI